MTEHDWRPSTTPPMRTFGGVNKAPDECRECGAERTEDNEHEECEGS